VVASPDAAGTCVGEPNQGWKGGKEGPRYARGLHRNVLDRAGLHAPLPRDGFPALSTARQEAGVIDHDDPRARRSIPACTTVVVVARAYIDAGGVSLADGVSGHRHPTPSKVINRDVRSVEE